MENIKQKALAKGKEFGLHLGYANKLEEYTDFVVDLAIAERDRNIIEMIDKDLNTYWRHPMALFPKDRTPQSELKEMKIKEDIIYLITNSKK